MFLIEKTENQETHVEPLWAVGYFMPQTYASVEGFSSSWYTVEVCQTKREAMLLVNLLNGGGLNSTVTEYKLSKQVRPFGVADDEQFYEQTMQRIRCRLH
jgi:hypothetical protein